MVPIINFQGPDWAAIKQWLLNTRDKKVELLIGASSPQDSDKVRGAIIMIDQLLRLDTNRS